MTRQPDTGNGDGGAAVRDLLDRAAGLPPDQRAKFLDRACGDDLLRAEVESLLAALDGAGGLLAEPTAAPAGGGPESDPVAERAGTMVGRYRLLEQIGEGGFGVVFMAEQERPVRRRVAVKVLKAGMDTRQVVARFEAERQALAVMDHPNIAKVHDGGSTDSGRPYFVMELVRGSPITDYCDRHHFDTRQRLDLFVQVCQAVQHAHLKGVIHRDLKPTNILVTVADDGRPVPKVIDFGIAKATAAGQRLTDRTLFTEFRQLLGTPLYMSPEQAEADGAADVDTRADVYALGVLLYELLTGTTPFEKERLAKAAQDEVRRIIRDEEPPRPSTRLSTLAGKRLAEVAAERGVEPARLGQLVRGELDWIVMRALEKDRTRRYETANGLARDVERYLSDELVEACPPSRAYRLRTLVRRHRRSLAIVAGFALLLCAATAVSMALAVRAARAEAAVSRERDQAVAERGRADEHAAVATAVNTFLGEMLAAADPERMMGERVTVLDATRGAVQKLDEGVIKERPLVEAAVRHVIGDTLRSLSRYEEAEPHLRKSLESRRDQLPADHPDTARSISSLSRLLYQRGKYPEAEALQREALATRRRSLSADHPDVADSLYRLGWILHDQGRSADAEPLFREALAIRRRVLPAGHIDLADSLNSVAVATQSRGGDLREVESLYRESLAIRQQALPPGHPRVARGQSNLAMVFYGQGRLRDAETLQHQALEAYRAALPSGHRDVAKAAYNLGRILQSQGRLDEAELLHRESLGIYRRLLPPDHPDLARSLSYIGSLLLRRGKAAEAEQMQREALVIRRKAYPAGHGEISYSLWELARALSEQGAFAEAEQHLREALAIRHKAYPADSQMVLLVFNRLISVLHAQGKAEDVLQLHLNILEHRRDALGPRHPLFGSTLRSIGDMMIDRGDAPGAEPFLRESLAILRAAAGGGNNAAACNDLGWALATCPLSALRNPAEAVAMAERAVEREPANGNFRNTLGVALYRAGDYTRAVAALEKATQCGTGGSSADHFFLAMTHWQLGDRETARACYGRGVKWMEQNQSDDPELRRFRAEAEQTLRLRPRAETRPATSPGSM